MLLTPNYSLTKLTIWILTNCFDSCLDKILNGFQICFCHACTSFDWNNSLLDWLTEDKTIRKIEATRFNLLKSLFNGLYELPKWLIIVKQQYKKFRAIIGWGKYISQSIWKLRVYYYVGKIRQYIVCVWLCGGKNWFW